MTSQPRASPRLSLWQGGLLFRATARIPLLRREPLDVRQRSIIAALVGWVPVLLLASVQALPSGEWPLLLLLPTTHVRWLVEMPLLFLAERLVDDRLGRMSQYLREASLLPAAAEAQLRTIEERATAACDSRATELALLVIAASTCVPAVQAANGGAELWHAAISLTLARLLVLRWIHRWCVWSVLLWRISRLELRLTALHPDGAAGLGALVLPSRALALVSAALGSVFAAGVYERLSPGETLGNRLPWVVTYVGICVVWAALPLVVFTPMLVRVKRRTLLELGVFAQRYTRDFEERWLGPSPDSPLGSADIQSLADLGNSHGIAKSMRLVPFPRDFLLQIVLAALAPLLPVYLASVSAATLASQLVKVIF